MEHDLLVADAFLRVAVGAVLAQAHAVAPAMAGDQEGRRSRGNGLCKRGRPSMRRRAGDEQEEGDE
jgi:hypothetical protein